MQPFWVGLLGGLVGSIPLAVLVGIMLKRIYFRRNITELKRIVDALVMPMTMQEWKEYERKFYEFRELIYTDSRDFLSH